MARRKRKKKRLPKVIEAMKARAAGMAAATRGRARTFRNRKKEAARRACRGKVDE